MEKPSKTNIDSFIIRFVQERAETEGSPSSYRGEIRHIQSDKETTFKCWADAQDFIQNFIPINQMLNTENGEIITTQSKPSQLPTRES